MQLKWLNVRFQQNPNDAIMIQMIISKVNPDVFIETGAAFGGSSIYFAGILRMLNPDGRPFHIISVDIKLKVGRAIKVLERLKLKQYVTFIQSSSIAPKAVEEVAGLLWKNGTQKVMVSLDSDHHGTHVYEEMKMYNGFVTPGSFMIVQDTRLSKHSLYCYNKFGDGPCDGPAEAVREFVKHDDFKSRGWRVAREYEFLRFTNHEGGFLVRDGKSGYVPEFLQKKVWIS
jgi:cephalosporin hydroxylase